MEGTGSARLPGSSAPQEQRPPHPATGTCFRKWCLGTLWENLDTALCSIDKNKVLPPPPSKRCWDLGTGAQSSGQRANGTPGCSNCGVSQGQADWLHTNPEGGGGSFKEEGSRGQTALHHNPGFSLLPTQKTEPGCPAAWNTESSILHMMG